MDQNTRNDIQRLVYENKVEPEEVFAQFLSILDDIETTYADRATIRTRNEEQKILTSRGTNYFTLVERSTKTKPDTIFAGALEVSPRKNKAPVVRVRGHNEHLLKVPGLFKFPFGSERNPEWTNVIISSLTIDMMKDLLHSEVKHYFEAN